MGPAVRIPLLCSSNETLRTAGLVRVFLIVWKVQIAPSSSVSYALRSGAPIVTNGRRGCSGVAARLIRSASNRSPLSNISLRARSTTADFVNQAWPLLIS
jgi:hypothetical protein